MNSFSKNEVNVGIVNCPKNISKIVGLAIALSLHDSTIFRKCPLTSKKKEIECTLLISI